MNFTDFVGLSAWLSNSCSRCDKKFVTSNKRQTECFLCTWGTPLKNFTGTTNFSVRCSGCNAVALRQDPLPFTCDQCVTQPIGYRSMKPTCLKCGADWCNALDFSPMKEYSGLCKRCQK